MTIKKGYIKINRAILHHPSLQKKDRSFCEIGAFIWLLLEASFASRKFRIKNTEIHLKRGQLCCSLTYMAQAFNWHKSKRGTKSEGLKAYKKIHGKVEPSLLIENYNAKSDSIDEKKFLAHFSRWLNSEGWTEELLTEKKTEDSFGIVSRNKYANLALWKKGIKTLNDFDEDIIKKYKEGEISKEAMEKLNISV